jgi:nicotinamidase-related amidase
MKNGKKLIANTLGGEILKQTLLIIDAQQELIEGNKEEQGVFEKEKIVTNINTVIEKAINADIPVVFIRDLDVSNGEGPGFQLSYLIKLPQTRFMALHYTNI